MIGTDCESAPWHIRPKQQCCSHYSATFAAFCIPSVLCVIKRVEQYPTGRFVPLSAYSKSRHPTCTFRASLSFVYFLMWRAKANSTREINLLRGDFVATISSWVNCANAFGWSFRTFCWESSQMERPWGWMVGTHLAIRKRTWVSSWL